LRPGKAAIVPLVLTALALSLAGLLLLAAGAPVLARRNPAGVGRVVHGGCLFASLVFVAGGMTGLLDGADVMILPFGPPWAPSLLAIDGLSAWFLMLLGISGACASLFAIGHEGSPPRVLAGFPLFLASMALTLLAADGFTLLLGFEAMSLASWVLVAASHGEKANRDAAQLYLVFAILAAACLIPALGLMAAGTGGDLGFGALRGAPPEGWRAALVLALVTAGAGAKAGLVPLHAWLPLAHPAAPSHASALMSGAMTKVAIYVLARLLFDLAGPAQPFWWGAPLVALGAASALLGALRANLETDSKTLLACSTIENVGLVAIGLGLAAAFRGADLGALAAVAAGAALLHALNHGVFKTLLFLVAGEVAHGAASRRLDRMGGLIRGMRATGACALVGAAAAASLPPLSGFSGEWLLLQALLAAWRVGDLAFQVFIAAATAVAALSAALAAAAMVRFFGLAFLGRPRTPRAAGAIDGKLPARLALIIPAGLTLLLGLIPGPMLQLASGALELLVAHDAENLAGLLTVRAGDAGAASYAPLLVAALLGLGCALFWLIARRRGPSGVVYGPAWDGGFIAPPPHLPFGDPDTQPSAAGFGQPLRRMLGESFLAAHERIEMPPPGDPRPARLDAGFEDPSRRLLLDPLAAARDAVATRLERLRDLSIRQCLSLSFGALVVLLALVAWLESGAAS
jgi:formate hydrogenlyase subunit 3/multisubunit Na+/H+ antiporter MnhD subunit